MATSSPTDPARAKDAPPAKPLVVGRPATATRPPPASRPPSAARLAPPLQAVGAAPAATGPPGRAAAVPAAALGALAIETHGLTKRYEGRAVVDDLTIRVPRGQVVGFVGPNGAGKTTTIRMLLGLIRPSAGDARILGLPIQAPSAYLPKVGALIEAPAFYPQLSGEANLRVLCRLGGFDPARVPLLMSQVGLAEAADQAYKGYSLGMKQRLGIAASLLPDPELVVLDEPTNGLDPAGIHEVRDFLRGLAKQGKTVFVSSHLLAEIQRICDHVIMLRQGRVIFQGTMGQLLARGTGIKLAAQDPRQHPALAALLRKAGFTVAEGPEGLAVQGVGVGGAAAINRAAFGAGIVLRELHAEGTDLEDTFLAMTGKGEP